MNGIRLNGKKRVVVLILSLLAVVWRFIDIFSDDIPSYYSVSGLLLYCVVQLLPALAVVLFAGVFCEKPKMRWWGSLCFLLPFLLEAVQFDIGGGVTYIGLLWVLFYSGENILLGMFDMFGAYDAWALLTLATMVLLLVIGIQSFKRRPTRALAWVALGTMALTMVFRSFSLSAVISWGAELLWVVCLLLMLPKWLSAGAAEKKLNKLNAARDAGKLTEADYAARRAKIFEML